MSRAERIRKVMEKRCSFGLFSLSFFIAFEPATAAQIEAVSENDKPLIRKSSGDRRFTVNSTAYSTKQPSARSPDDPAGFTVYVKATTAHDQLMNMTPQEIPRRMTLLNGKTYDVQQL